MKKILLFVFIFFVFLVPKVKADTTTIDIMKQDFIRYDYLSSYIGCLNCSLYLSDKYVYNDFSAFYSNPTNKAIFDKLWDENSSPTHYGNDIRYHYHVLILSKSSTKLDLFGVITTWSTTYKNSSNQTGYALKTNMYLNGTYYSVLSANTKTQTSQDPGNVHYSLSGGDFYPYRAFPWYTAANPFHVGSALSDSSWFYLPTTSFMSNPVQLNEATDIVINLYDSNNEQIGSYSYGSELPQLYTYGEFNPTSNYTTVNLDDYEYVILSLKDYSKKDAFSSDLQVKGQIGITPVYNYGQTSKDDIINNKVETRCNAAYSDYTSYSLYVTSPDLDNNAVYYIKECINNSSFKFDNNVFNITYITSDNVNNPVITIGDHSYNVIPYGDLPSTATKNEEENYIPGESENAITGNSTGLSSIVKNVQNKLSEIWNIFTYFMSFVNQIFSVFPDEFRTVLLASFTIGCVLGLIKILKA